MFYGVGAIKAGKQPAWHAGVNTGIKGVKVPTQRVIHAPYAIGPASAPGRLEIAAKEMRGKAIDVSFLTILNGS